LKIIIKKSLFSAEMWNWWCGTAIPVCSAKVHGMKPGSKWCGGARCGTGKPVRVPTTV